jgi:hippurate hydrolase
MPIVHVRQEEFTPATYNNPELTKRLMGVWRQSLGEDKVEITEPTMGGEDFSEFTLEDRSVPTCMFWVGAVDPAKMAESKRTGAALPSLHSSKFAPAPEPTIRAGVIAMTSAVLELMKK